MNEVVYISGDGKLPSHGLWLKNDEETGYLMVTADTEEDLRSSSSSWDALSETFPELLNHILELLKVLQLYILSLLL